MKLLIIPKNFLIFHLRILKPIMNLRIGELQIKIKLGIKIKKTNLYNITKRQVISQPLTTSKHFEVKLDLFSKTQQNEKNLKLNLQILEKINVDQFIPKKLKKVKFHTSNIST